MDNLTNPGNSYTSSSYCAVCGFYKQPTALIHYNGVIICETCYYQLLKMEQNKINTLPYYGEQPFCCPVCSGRGFVAPLYYQQGDMSTAIVSYPTCRTCNGSGIVWQDKSGKRTI